VVLALDADSSGQEAMLRAQRVAGDRRMRLRVAAMPAGEDPAEMLAEEGGAERFRELVGRAVELAEFRVDLVLARADAGSPAERDRALTEVAPVLAGMGETASRDELVRRVSERLDLEPAMVIGRLATARSPVEGPVAVGPAPRAELTSRERRERALLAMCIALPKEGEALLARLTSDHLSTTGERAREWLTGRLADPVTGLPHDDPELASLVSELVMMARSEPASAEAMELNLMQLEQRRLEARIGEAGESGDYERKAELSRERAALVERIARTERVAS
jgi:DNA primase